MKIILEYPYNQDYDAGYVLTNRENRKMVYLTKGSMKTTTAYGRYILSVKLGRYLLPSETADHMDNDKTNDTVDNLQILSIKDNIIKAHALHVANLEHGTYAKYRTGKCRCSLCVNANRVLQKESYYRNRELRNTRRNARRRSQKYNSNSILSA